MWENGRRRWRGRVERAGCLFRCCIYSLSVWFTLARLVPRSPNTQTQRRTQVQDPISIEGNFVYADVDLAKNLVCTCGRSEETAGCANDGLQWTYQGRGKSHACEARLPLSLVECISCFNLHSISESAWCSSTGLRFNLLVSGSTDFTSEHLIAGIVSQVNKRSLVSRKALWKDGIIPYTLRIEGSRKS